MLLSARLRRLDCLDLLVRLAKRWLLRLLLNFVSFTSLCIYLSEECLVTASWCFTFRFDMNVMQPDEVDVPNLSKSVQIFLPDVCIELSH